eukprot:gb/GECH01013001.1/.p1 GENE.gb/GECH01013001.1/~~gb/GECH01013001.1/.p1  ORF type:complete len:400 (+),score=76.37 gb/GECH01013001.1/:1-1200(+)
MSKELTQDYKKLFHKHSSMIVQAEEPFNAEPSISDLASKFVTPNDKFYVRNHAPVPHVDVSKYRLHISGIVSQPLELSLSDLKNKFEKHRVMAVMQCAGNRRKQLIEYRPLKGEVPWGNQALGNAVWGGVRLRDVLHAAGIKATENRELHVDFLGLDVCEKEGMRFRYGSSIPLSKALAEEVILAYEMNSESLPEVHGFPLRAVVPGYIGARSVKWLSSITVQTERSFNYYQRKAYKLFPSNITAETADWKNDGIEINTEIIRSFISSPTEGATIPTGNVCVRGFATCGGGRTVERVDVTLDEGKTWTRARILPAPYNQQEMDRRWVWVFWQADLNISREGPITIGCRAFDSECNTQPEHASLVWNYKGYMNNSWDRVQVTAKQIKNLQSNMKFISSRL